MRFADLGGRHRVGQAPVCITIAALIFVLSCGPQDKSGISENHHPEVIIEIMPLVICIAWLGVNQEVSVVFFSTLSLHIRIFLTPYITHVPKSSTC